MENISERTFAKGNSQERYIDIFHIFVLMYPTNQISLLSNFPTWIFKNIIEKYKQICNFCK